MPAKILWLSEWSMLCVHMQFLSPHLQSAVESTTSMRVPCGSSVPNSFSTALGSCKSQVGLNNKWCHQACILMLNKL